MADGLQIEFGDDVARVLHVFKELSAHVQKGVVQGAQRGLLLAETRVRQNTALKWRRGAAGLSGRLTSFARIANDDIEGAIGFRKTSRFPYELAQEFGANAHKGAMAIPVSPQAKAASNRGIGPLELGIPLRLVKGMGKALLIQDVYRKGTGIGIKSIVHYVLKKSIPARLKFRENVKAALPEIENGIFDGFKNGAAA